MRDTHVVNARYTDAKIHVDVLVALHRYILHLVIHSEGIHDTVVIQYGKLSLGVTFVVIGSNLAQDNVQEMLITYPKVNLLEGIFN